MTDKWVRFVHTATKFYDDAQWLNVRLSLYKQLSSEGKKPLREAFVGEELAGAPRKI